MSAAVKVRSNTPRLAYVVTGPFGRMRSPWLDWVVDTSEGCRCKIGLELAGVIGLEHARLYADLGHAFDFARAHAATHTCPSWRASGERCTPACADCGGAGWVRQPGRARLITTAELGIGVA